MSYLGLFMETYKLSSSWFYIAYMKTSVIMYGGALWALAFQLPLYPWSTTNETLKGLHFIFTLCLYDGALTVTSLAHSSLLADLAVTTAKRSQWNKFAAWFGVAGANSIVLSQLLGNGSNLPAFRVLATVFSLVACGMFMATATHLAPLELQARRTIAYQQESEPVASGVNTLTLSKQLLRHNFVIYCLIGIIQVFNCHFNSNLLALVLDRVFQSSTSVQTIVLFGSAVLPQVCVALLADSVVSRGLYTVVLGLLLAKTGVAVLNSIFGDPASMVPAALFLLANKVVTEVLCRHSGLVVADVVDEDAYLYRRIEPLSSLVFGVWGLATRPGQSVGPILGWIVFDVGRNSHSRLFSLLSLVPIACGTAQLLLWSQYTLKGAYLKQVKEHRTKGNSEV